MFDKGYCQVKALFAGVIRLGGIWNWAKHSTEVNKKIGRVCVQHCTDRVDRKKKGTHKRTIINI